MKIALVQDDLIQFGGAESLLMAAYEVFPDAPIYISVVSKKWKKILKENNIEYETSFMQRLPFIEKLYRYYSPFLLHALAFESFDFSKFDLVISFSTRYAHGIVTKPTTKHICYMNSPGRMLWEVNDYFKDEEYGFPKPIKILARPFLAPFLSHLRTWDYTVAQRVDHFIANSKTPQDRIKKYYGRDATIIYPPVDVKSLLKVKPSEGEYFVVLTRLVSWKKVDIAINACIDLGLPLVVIGEGPDRNRLEELSKGQVRFTGYISDAKKIEILSKCRAVIVTQKEDFGIVPVETMALGKPVIAYRNGGSLETIVEGKTGVFFDEQTPDSLKSVLQTFDLQKYSDLDCKDQAKKFDKKIFKQQLRRFVNMLKFKPRTTL